MKNQKKQRKTVRVTLQILLLLLQAVVSSIAVYQVIRSNMVPSVLLVSGIIMLLAFEIGEGLLFFRKPKRKLDEKTGLYLSVKRRWKKNRVIAASLSVIMIIITGCISYYIGKMNDTMEQITAVDSQTITIGVYVLKDSPAQTIEDVKDATFGISNAYDSENVGKTVNDINTHLGKEVATSELESVNAMIDALYAKSVDAIILNEAYIGVLDDQEGYQSFKDDTRVIYEYKIQVAVEEKRNIQITKDPFIMYISGSDTRSSKLDTSRSDVNLLAVVNPSTKQVLLLNTPRDYYVNTSVSGGVKDKLTHAGIYGVQCSMDTLGMLYDEPVDYYMQINFEGFKTMIDAVGGITVEADKTITTDDGYQIYEGTNEMDGDKALSFVRERHAYADGDNARGRNQMKVISAIISKISSGTTILTHYSDIMNSMEGMFVMDMTSDDIGALVKMQLSDGSSWNVKSYAVTGFNDSNVTYSAPTQNTYVMDPDQATVDHAKSLIDKVYAGDILTDEDLIIQ